MQNSQKKTVWSLVYNKVAPWKNSQKLQEKTYARVLFITKMMAGATISTYSLLIYLHFVIAKSKNFVQCRLTHNWKLQQLFTISQYHILRPGFWWGSVKKKLVKVNGYRPQLRAGASSVCVKSLPSWNTTDFTYYLSYIIA